MDEITKKSVIAQRCAGRTNKEVGKSLGLHPITVSKVFNEFKKQAPTEDGIDKVDDKNFKRRLAGKAVVALESGLDCTDDKYKAGRLGLETPRGTRHLYDEQTGNVEANINLLVANIPAGFEEMLRRHSTPDELAAHDAIAIEAAGIVDTSEDGPDGFTIFDIPTPVYF